jgi:hypothetical protein
VAVSNAISNTKADAMTVPTKTPFLLKFLAIKFCNIVKKSFYFSVTESTTTRAQNISEGRNVWTIAEVSVNLPLKNTSTPMLMLPHFLLP